MLADYVSDTSPMIPPLVVHCVNEIEQRGIHEVSGASSMLMSAKCLQGTVVFCLVSKTCLTNKKKR